MDSEIKVPKKITKPFYIIGIVSACCFALFVSLIAAFIVTDLFESLFFIPVIFIVVAEILGITYLIKFWSCMQYNQKEVWCNHASLSYRVLGGGARALAVYCGIIFPLFGFLHIMIILDAQDQPAL